MNKINRLGKWIVAFFLILSAFESLAKTVDLGRLLGPATGLIDKLNACKDRPTRGQLRAQLDALNEEYQTLIESLNIADSVAFSDGKAIRLVGFLGKGSRATVWKTEDGKALRLPLNTLSSTLSEFQRYPRGWAKLRKLSSHVISFFSDPENPEYQLVELINPGDNQETFTFDEFWEALRESDGKLERFKGFEVSDLLSSLDEINRDLAEVIFLGEGLQMAWSGKSWRFYDFGDGQDIVLVYDPKARRHLNHTIWTGYRWKYPKPVVNSQENGPGKVLTEESEIVQVTPPILKRLITAAKQLRKIRACERSMTDK